MFGNWQGWIISAVIVAGIVLLLTKAEKFEHTTAPTALSDDPKNLAPLSMTIEPDSILPELNGPAQNAGLQDEALELYRADAFAYDRFSQTGTDPSQIAQLAALPPFMQFCLSPTRPIFADTPHRIITYNRTPHLDAIGALGRCLVRAGLLLQQSEPSKAREYYSAALAIGVKLCDERLRHRELAIGLELLALTVPQLSKLEADPKRAAELRSFEESRRDFSATRVKPMWTAMGAVDPSLTARHAGDVLLFARRANERLWRVEAILTLGRWQYSSDRQSDRRAAARLLKQLSTDSDPSIRAAATAALNLTIEQFRMISQ
ncbi:MAG: hypothetical protein ACREJC_23070 [Tepidisphaeraceae bacterium]